MNRPPPSTQWNQGLCLFDDGLVFLRVWSLSVDRKWQYGLTQEVLTGRSNPPFSLIVNGYWSTVVPCFIYIYIYKYMGRLVPLLLFAENAKIYHSFFILEFLKYKPAILNISKFTIVTHYKKYKKCKSLSLLNHDGKPENFNRSVILFSRLNLNISLPCTVQWKMFPIKKSYNSLKTSGWFTIFTFIYNPCILCKFNQNLMKLFIETPWAIRRNSPLKKWRQPRDRQK